MWSLLDRAFQPSTTFIDKVTYLFSSRYHQSFRADSSEHLQILEAKIKKLLLSPVTRCEGLLLFETALQQCPNLVVDMSWAITIVDVLKAPGNHVSKQLACKILCMVVTNMPKVPNKTVDPSKQFLSSLMAVILEKSSGEEWFVDALKCVTACIKSFPAECSQYKVQLLEFLLSETDCLSTVTCEAIANVFAALPSCSARNSVKIYKETWLRQYSMILNTMNDVLNKYLYLSNETTAQVTVDSSEIFQLRTAEDDFGSQMIAARQFVTLCKCLAQMLSSSSDFYVDVPLKDTLNCIRRILCPNGLMNKKPVSLEDHLGLTVLPMLQNAAMVLLEAVVLNFNLLKHGPFIAQLLLGAIQASNGNVSSKVSINQMRAIIWRVATVWSNSKGTKGSHEIANHRIIFEELIKDISLEMESLEDGKSRLQSSVKPKEKMISVSKEKDNPDISAVTACIEALRALTDIIYTASPFMKKKLTEKILGNILLIIPKIQVQLPRVPPFPYNHEKCRKNLYSLLLAIAVTAYPQQSQPIMQAIGIFSAALNDSSVMVTGFCYRAHAICRLFLHPKKPPPLSVEERENTDENIQAVEKKWNCGWETDVSWLAADNPSRVDETSNQPEIQVASTFHASNEQELHIREFVPVERFSPPHYSDQPNESQCNGEVAVAASSSQVQDVEHKDENFGAEVPMVTDTMYIPQGSEMQTLNIHHINSLNEHSDVTSQEYEGLKVEEKDPAKTLPNCNKNVKQNGVCIDEDLPGTSEKAPENGIFVSEEEDMDEEEEDEDEEEEDEEEPEYNRERKLSNEYYDLPSKKQKLCNEEESEEEVDEEEQEVIRKSPTLQEMEEDFILCEPSKLPRS